MHLDESQSIESPTTEEMFLARYEDSRLLTLEEVAKVLRRKPGGLRMTLAGDNEVSRKLRPAKLKIGRRVLFRAKAVAEYLAKLQPEGA